MLSSLCVSRAIKFVKVILLICKVVLIWGFEEPQHIVVSESRTAYSSYLNSALKSDVKQAINHVIMT